MITLACDTSTTSCSAALLDGHTLLAWRKASGVSMYSVTFMPMVARLMEECGIAFPDIDLYACAVGPGSFTGLRIGVASVQAMAYASGRPAVGVPTLEALAWPLMDREDAIVCPVMDARNRRVYCQAFFGGSSIRDVAVPPAGMDIEAFLDVLSGVAASRKILFCGDAAETCYLAAVARMGEDRVLPPAHRDLVPEWVGLAGLALYGDGPAERYPAHALLPFYLGASQAERTTGIDSAGWTAPGMKTPGGKG